MQFVQENPENHDYISPTSQVRKTAPMHSCLLLLVYVCLARAHVLSAHVYLSLDQGCSAKNCILLTISVCMCMQTAHFDQWKFMQVSGERETIREHAREHRERTESARENVLHVFCNRTLCASVRALPDRAPPKKKRICRIRRCSISCLGFTPAKITLASKYCRICKRG